MFTASNVHFPARDNLAFAASKWKVVCSDRINFAARKVPFVFTAANVKLSLQSVGFQLQTCIFAAINFCSCNSRTVVERLPMALDTATGTVLLSALPHNLCIALSGNITPCMMSRTHTCERKKQERRF